MKAAIYTLQSKYYKYQMLVAAFALFLQRSPVMRIAAAMERTIKVPFTRLAQLATVAFTASSIPQSVTGATTFSSNPSSPATAKTGESFNLVFSVTGAKSTAQSYRIKGTLPQGLSIAGLSGETLNSKTGGTITGTPTETGTFDITVQAYSSTNRRGDTNGEAYPISIIVEQGAPTVPVTTFTATPSSNETGEVGQSFSQSFSIAGITAASWEVLGTLPPGLSVSGPNGETLSGSTLNAVSGTISGTPTTAGSYNLTVQAYDAANLSGVTDGTAYPLSITISERTFQNPYEEWSFNNFGILNAPINEDPDQDGFSNLTEYAFGLDPASVDLPQSVSQTTTQQGNEIRFTHSFQRLPARNDIDIIVETTTSLDKAWTPIATSQGGQPFTGVATIEETALNNALSQVSIQESVPLATGTKQLQRIRIVKN